MSTNRRLERPKWEVFMRHLFRSAGVAALALTACAVVSPAAAQTAAVAAPSAGGQAATDNTTIEELVVTATKREQSLRDIPETISAVTAGQLDATGPVINTGDLLRTVAGVRFNNLQSPNLSEISIRGSGTERATGADSGVGLFVNGAYAGSSTLGGRNFKNIDFFDLDRVEVLEGPQSALYGRNAEFGVVNVVLAKPKFEDSGFINESYTDRLDQNQLQAVGNYAFNDDLAVRIGAETIGQTKGFYINPDNNQYYDQTNGWLARGQVRYRHGPADIDFLIDSQDLTLPTFVSGLAITPGTVAAVPLGYTSNRFSVPSNGINDTEQRVNRAQLMADFDLGWATLTSTTMATQSTSLQWFGAAIDTNIDAQFQKEGEAGVYPFTQVHTAAKDRTYYEDLHLGGKALDGALDWLGGVEILDQTDSNLLTTATSPCALGAAASICTGTPAMPQCLKLLPTDANCPATFPATFGAATFTPQRYTSEAVYGSAGYKVGNFTLTGELRYTNDLKKATQFPSALFTNVPGKVSSFKFAASRTNYAVTVSYKLPGPWDDMIYAKTGTGYRAGGVNSGASTPVAPVPFRSSYGDEDTTSYEVGFKGNFTPHVYVTLDGYISDTENAITVINDGCAVTNICGQAATIFNINGGTIHANGIEASIAGHYQVAGGALDVSLNGANQHAHFVSVDGTNAGLPIVGSTVAQIPRWTSSASVNYKHAITDSVDGFFQATYNGQSGGGQDTTTKAAPFIPLSSITNVSLRFGADYKKLEAAVFVQNLTDESIRLLVLQAAGVTNAVRYNQPRTVGVNLIYRF
jgi:iron complex outermembrane receptor protein